MWWVLDLRILMASAAGQDLSIKCSGSKLIKIHNHLKKHCIRPWKPAVNVAFRCPWHSAKSLFSSDYPQKVMKFQMGRPGRPALISLNAFFIRTAPHFFWLMLSLGLVFCTKKRYTWGHLMKQKASKYLWWLQRYGVTKGFSVYGRIYPIYRVEGGVVVRTVVPWSALSYTFAQS